MKTKKKPYLPDRQQAYQKDAIRAWLIKHPHMGLSDVCRETCIALPTMYMWVNGVTTNFRTPAYVQAVNKWVKAHEND